MKQITTNNRTLLFVEVPEDWTREDYILHWKSEHYAKPNHNYRFIATTDTITEEQADKIVDKSAYNRMLYLNYQFGGVNEYALDSFKSLLKHHSITGRHAILLEL